MAKRDKKYFLKSKTFWAGLLEMSAGLFDVLSGQIFVCTFYGVKAGWILILFGALKIGLRHATKSQVRFK